MKKVFNRLTLWHGLIFLLILVAVLPLMIHGSFVILSDQPLASMQWQGHLILIGLSIAILSFPSVWLLLKLKQKEQQSTDTRRNVAALIDHAADMILITRPNGQIVNANRKACDILGYSIDELQSMQTMDLDVDCVLYRTPKLHQQLFSGQSVSFESLYRSKQGLKIPVENSVSIAGWMEGTFYLEIARDITRRRQVEQELHASKEALERVRNRLETRMQERTEKLVEEVQKRELTEKRIYEIRLLLENLVNSMPSAIIALDDQLQITQWNLEAEKVFGILEVAAYGKNVVQLLPQLRSTIFRLIRRSNNGKSSLTQRISIELNHQPQQFEVMIYPLSQMAGTDSPGVVIRLDDITEKVRFDEMLVQTEKMLSLGGLAAGMAHEINNPLGAILQSAQNIVRRLSPELPRNQKIAAELTVDLTTMQQYIEQQKIHQSLNAIRDAGERAATIVSDMLSFARPGQSERSEIDVTEVLDASIRLAEKDYNQKRNFDFRNINIVRDYQPGLPNIYVHKNQLSQVLLNLLINAAQALSQIDKSLRPTIWLSARKEDEFICIEVKDNGPGMDEITRRRVFEPFFTTKAEGSGTGLGLSVSYFIVTEQLGGRMMVSSTPGKETVFSIFIPYLDHPTKLISMDPAPMQLPLDNL